MELRSRLVASVLTLFVPFGASLGQLTHAHLDDHHDAHHEGVRVHAHLAAHRNSAAHHHDGPILSEAEDVERTIALQLFIAASPETPPLPGLPASPLTIVSLWTPAPRGHQVVTHGHDPPAGAPRIPRAPPRLHLS